MIEVSQVQKVSGADTVLNLDSLKVESGQIAAVLGPKGSGKAVLLALLTGQIDPTAGRIRVAGLDPKTQRDLLLDQIGVLFAENALYNHLTVRANLIFYSRLRGTPIQRVDDVLSQVGLVDQAGVLAGKLAYALARRLAFGRAILHQPQVLILVEPFSGCNPASVEVMTRLLEDLAEQGKTIFVLSTEATGLLNLCQIVYTLNRGQIVEVRHPQDENVSDTPFKIPVRLESKVVLLNPAEILYVSTQESRTHLHTLEDEFPSQFTMQELETRLLRSGFFRAHRSYLVNLQRVQAVIPYTRNSFTLVLDDPTSTEIPLSKMAARELRDLFDY